MRAGIKTESVEGKVVLLFTVEPSPVIHRLADGRYLYLVGAADALLPVEKIHALKQARLQVTFEREFVPGASPADLDGRALSWFLERTGGSGDDPVAVLEDFHLPERYNGQTYLTPGCLLLFARDPIRWHPRPGIDFVRFEGADPRDGAARLAPARNTPLYDEETLAWLQRLPNAHRLNARQNRSRSPWGSARPSGWTPATGWSSNCWTTDGWSSRRKNGLEVWRT